VLLLLAWATRTWAAEPVLDLVSLFDASRLNDASYRTAIFDYQASQNEEAVARGALLPQVSLGARYGKGGPLGSGSKVDYAQSDVYTSNTATLSVQQALYDKGRWASYEQGKARGALGEHQFDEAGQQLYLRVVEAYFDVARAENELSLAEQQKAAIAGLARQARRLYEAGEGTITDSEEAQSRLDLIEAQEIELVARRRAALRKLAARTGMSVSDIVQMREQAPVPPLLAPEQDLRYWMDQALASSPQLASQRASIRVAETESDAQRAGHYPTLALTGQLAQTDETDYYEDRQRQSSYYVGVSVNVPIYEGGSVTASVRRADAQLYSARAQLDAQLQTLSEDVETDYLGVVAGYEKGKALLTAVSSSQRALESAQKGYQSGVRSTTDILDAQQQLFQARRDLLNARLDMLTSYVSLHARAGRMDRAILQQVQALL
jgi:protease secretion system outer membrane protein